VDGRVLAKDEVSAAELGHCFLALNVGVVLADSLISGDNLLPQSDVCHLCL